LIFDQKEAEKMESRIRSNNFDFNDFKLQLNQIRKMGSMKDILGMMPGLGSKIKNLDMDDRKFKWVEAIINSMTIEERSNPDIMTGSRRKRIANGAGRSIQEVNQLLKQFTMMKNMMKKMNKRTKFRFPI
jgi:signal recognition particle subunit SRP54